MVTRDELFEQRFFLLDFEMLSGVAGLLGKWSSLGEELEDRIERVCRVFGLAMHHMVDSPANLSRSSILASESEPDQRTRQEIERD